MKLFPPARLFAPLSLFLVTFATAAYGQYTNGQSASSVLGQGTFHLEHHRHHPIYVQQSARRAGRRRAATGKIFVVDSTNNRVLRFSSSNALNSGTAASFVFGQTSFTTATAATSQTGLRNPTGATLDSSGNLWVADTGNNRVVAYANAVNLVQTAGGALRLFSTGTDKLHPSDGSPQSVRDEWPGNGRHGQ